MPKTRLNPELTSTGLFLWVAWPSSKWHLLTSKDRTHCGKTTRQPFLGVDATSEYCQTCRRHWHRKFGN